MAYIPDPPKASSGGEDASFVSPSGLSLGVADGVGGWREQGVDPGVYARLLMHNAQVFCDAAEAAGVAANAGAEGAAAAQAEELPLQAIEQAAARTTVPGGSTCCIVLLRGRRLWAANLGDSGFIVLRRGQLYYRSGQQQHSFNFPFQLRRVLLGMNIGGARCFRVTALTDAHSHSSALNLEPTCPAWRTCTAATYK